VTGSRWNRRGFHREGIARLEAFAAALAGDDPALLSLLLAALASIAAVSGHVARALEVAPEAVALARASGDSAGLARTLNIYARSAARARRFDDAEAALAEAEAIPQPSALSRLRLLDTRANLSLLCGDLDTAARAYEQLRMQSRALGDHGHTLAANLAEIEHARGDTRRAIALVREMLAAVRADAAPGAVSAVGAARTTNALANLAGYLAAVDDLPAARDISREVIRKFAARDPQSLQIANAAEHLALALALAGDLPRAARLGGYADAALLGLGYARQYTETTTHDRLAALLDERLAPGLRERLRAEGAALTPEAAIALALDEP
jgi:hypothetical protein